MVYPVLLATVLNFQIEFQWISFHSNTDPCWQGKASNVENIHRLESFLMVLVLDFLIIILDHRSQQYPQYCNANFWRINYRCVIEKEEKSCTIVSLLNILLYSALNKLADINWQLSINQLTDLLENDCLRDLKEEI